jgi:transcriptional regulator with XRE-family HTH domain
MADNDIRVIVGKNIRNLRKAKGWSQETLAFEAGLHRTYIGDIERGERNVSVVNVQKIANALGVPAADLLRDETVDSPEK